MNGSFISGFETATAIYFSDVNNGLYCTNAGRIVKTIDGGSSWSLTYTMSGGIWGISFVNAQTGYGCTSTGKVLKTTNAGNNWGEQNTPLSENLYEISFPSVNTGYICSWSGKILKTTNGGLTYITKNETGIPKDYSLSQNYPNPFNPSTNIKFDIARLSRGVDEVRGVLTTLKIYDISGKEIATLVNEQLQPGTYEVTFNSYGLPSGVYFYKLTAGNYSETKKMILMK